MRASIDTNIFVSVRNREEPYCGPSRAVLDMADEGALEGVVSTVVVTEICSGYHTAGELKEKDEFLTHILTSPNYVVADVSVDIADEAGRIRAEAGLKLPDALMVTAGLKMKADYLITYDESLREADSYVEAITAGELVEMLGGRSEP
ncbi:MAG: type II toxin-antitoxin system VapC family toxin [Candidatus Geothermarchaeales archaeon]